MLGAVTEWGYIRFFFLYEETIKSIELQSLQCSVTKIPQASLCEEDIYLPQLKGLRKPRQRFQKVKDVQKACLLTDGSFSLCPPEKEWTSGL